MLPYMYMFLLFLDLKHYTEVAKFEQETLSFLLDLLHIFRILHIYGTEKWILHSKLQIVEKVISFLFSYKFLTVVSVYADLTKDQNIVVIY
jgi:hypothetical protein